MKKSFKDIDTTVTDVPATEVSSTETPAADPTAAAGVTEARKNTNTEVVPDSYFSNEGLEGDFNKHDVRPPRLNLVQNVGPLRMEHDFPAGNFVFDGQLDLGPGPLEFTITRMRKYYMEDIPYTESQKPDAPKPKIMMSEAEIRKAGCFMSWEKKTHGEDQVYFKQVLEVEILLKGNAGNTLFPLEFEGMPYARCLWTLQSIAYSKAGVAMITASQLGLRKGIYTRGWSLKSHKIKVGANWIYVPIVNLTAPHSDAFIAFIKSLL